MGQAEGCSEAEANSCSIFSQGEHVCAEEGSEKLCRFYPPGDLKRMGGSHFQHYLGFKTFSTGFSYFLRNYCINFLFNNVVLLKFALFR